MRLQAFPDLSAALSDCFEAVMAPERWDDATERLALALKARGVGFHDRGASEAQRLRAPMSRAYREMFADYLARGWEGQNLRAIRGWPLADQGEFVVTEAMVSTPEERARLPIYAELFRGHGAEDWAATTFPVGGQTWALTLVRPADGADLAKAQAGDDSRLRLSRPYLARMLSFSQALSLAASEGALGALEHAATPALILDGQGRVAVINGPAEALLGHGLSVVQGRLRADRGEINTALEARIASALNAMGSPLGVDSGPLAVPTPWGGVLLADVTPLRGAAVDAFGRAGAMVTLVDPLRRPKPSVAMLRQLYGLTQRESELAVLIARGDGVPEMAQTMGLQASSVRQIIKALLWKTGARRQSELTALFAGLPSAE